MWSACDQCILGQYLGRAMRKDHYCLRRTMKVQSDCACAVRSGPSLYTACMLWVLIRNASAIIFWHENMLWILLGTVSEVLLMITHHMFSCRNKKDNSIFLGGGRGGMKSLSGAMCRAISAGHVRHKVSFYLEGQIIIGATLGGNGSSGQRSVRILLSVDVS